MDLFGHPTQLRQFASVGETAIEVVFTQELPTFKYRSERPVWMGHFDELTDRCGSLCGSRKNAHPYSVLVSVASLHVTISGYEILCGCYRSSFSVITHGPESDARKRRHSTS